MEDRSCLFTLVEAMKLNSVDSAYINKHYLKLLENYNPLEVKRRFLITYYSGSSFAAWWDRYTDHIKSLDMSVFAHPDYSPISTVVGQETPFGSVKKLHHHIEVGGEPALCTHFAIRLGR